MMMPLNLYHSRQGFTLIEVLIALFITAVIGVMAFLSLDTATDAVDRNRQQSERLDNINRLFTVLGRDLRHSVQRGIRDENGSRQLAFELNEDGRLSFTRRAWFNPREGQIKRSELQRLEYRLEDETLYRRTWYSLDRSDDSTMIEAPLLHDIKMLRYQVLWQNREQLQANPLGGKWLSIWPDPAAGSQQNTLPFALEITLELEDLGEIKRVYELNHGS